MHNFRSPPRHIKLDRHVGMPSLRTLEEMRQKVNANAGSTVELPFGNEVETLILTVSREVSKGSWSWMLYVDDGFGSKMEWSYVTPDSSYIHGLIGNSHPNLQIKARPGATPDGPLNNQEPVIKPRKGSLVGDLKNIQITNLLQSISMGQMTGKLEITSANDTAIVLFVSGKPVHAVLRGAEGNEALIQLFVWQDGDFAFYDEPVNNVVVTVTRGLTGLMMEGTAFVDHSVFLKDRGLTHQAYPIKVRQVQSLTEVADDLNHGVECDMGLQEDIYHKINGTSTWADIERTLSAKKTEWVPALFNLVSCHLIRFEQQPAAPKQPLISKIDWSVVQALKNSMCRADTGLHTYAAMLYSLEQEYFRYESFEVPFSLIIFGFCDKYNQIQNGEQTQFIPVRSQAIAEMREKVFKTKRKYDVVSHYGTFNYAVVLPFAVKENAKRFAEILAEICAEISISDQWERARTQFRAGIASIPSDCRTLEDMITIAEKVNPLSG